MKGTYFIGRNISAHMADGADGFVCGNNHKITLKKFVFTGVEKQILLNHSAVFSKKLTS